MNSKFKEFLEGKGLTEASLKEKSAEELALLYNEFNVKQRGELENLIKEGSDAAKAAVETLKAELKETQTEQLKQLNEVLKEHGLAIKKFMSAPTEKKETFSGQLHKSLEANIEKLKTLKEGGVSEAKGAAFEFSVKVPATMTNANVSGGNVPVEDRLEGFNVVPSRRVRLMDVMSKRNTTSNVVSWVYQANKDGAAGQTGEGLAKNQIDFDIVVANESVKKTTAFIKVSTEMLDDVEWIQSEIEQELMKELLKALESTVYEGDGTGQNHLGITTVASAFAAGSFANEVDNANEVDVLVVAMNQINVAQEGDAMANYIFMHSTDVTKLKVAKVSSTDKRYVERLSQVGSTLLLDGVPIIQTTLLDEGDYLVGDFSLALLVTRTEMKFDIGLDADDFTKNLRTILAEWRGLTVVKNNDRSAFVYSDFATDIAALLKP